MPTQIKRHTLGIGENSDLVRVALGSGDTVVSVNRVGIGNLSEEELNILKRACKPAILGYRFMAVLLRDGSYKLIPVKAKAFIPLTPIYYLPFIRAFAQDKDSLPTTIDLDISEECTDNCNFCFTREYRYSRAASDRALAPFKYNKMPFATIKALIEKCSGNGTRQVRFVSGGEPLTHPDFREILALVKKHSLLSTLSTNGVLLDEYNSELIADSMALFRISINAGTEETRGIIHSSPKSLNEIVCQLKRVFLNRDKAKRVNEMTIGCTYLVQTRNIKEMSRFVEMVAPWTDYVSFQCVYGKSSASFSDEEIADLRKQVGLISRIQGSVSVCYSAKIRSILTSSKSPVKREPSDWQYCLVSFSMPVIEANGTVQICRWLRGCDDEKMILNRSLDPMVIENTLLKHPMSKRRIHMEEEMTEHCKVCCSYNVNLTLNRMLKLIQADKDAKFYVLHDHVPQRNNLSEDIY